MIILDIGILADAINKLRCTSCTTTLSLFETDFEHGWQTTYSIKCTSCHLLLAEFPSSKPMEVSPQTNYVNVSQPLRALNEVTMRSVIAVHCSGFSWRDLHKFAIIFDMPPPLGEMPPRYLNKIERVVEVASQTSMNAAAEAELHLRVDAIPSPVTNCINIAVSFDSSWKTRGFYSNLSLVPLSQPPQRKYSITSFSIGYARSAIDGPTNAKWTTPSHTKYGTRATT